MNFDQPKDPGSDMKIEYGGKAVTDFKELEEQKKEVEKLVNKYSGLGMDPSSVIPDGKGNFNVHGTQLMDLNEFKEYLETLSKGRDSEALLMAERKKVALEHRILNPEEITRGEGGKWYFHGSPLED